jgi:hypothetical protein
VDPGGINSFKLNPDVGDRYRILDYKTAKMPVYGIVGSVSDSHSLAAVNQIRIPNSDPGPGAKRKERTQPNDRLLGIKSNVPRVPVSSIKMVKCGFQKNLTFTGNLSLKKIV